MIGIVGLGDLGGRLAAQVLSTGSDVLTYETATPLEPPSAVDPALDITGFTWPTQAKDLDELLDKCNIVHWCAPLEALKLTIIPAGKILVLHNSVMHGSVQAKQPIEGDVQIVHCLMNQSATVVVAEDSGNTLDICGHLKDLGLRVVTMTSDEHDALMAQSQGIFALLINHGLRSRLKSWHNQGLLTSSAEELLKAIEHRESQWTGATIKAILSNPSLKIFAEELNKDLKK